MLVMLSNLYIVCGGLGLVIVTWEVILCAVAFGYLLLQVTARSQLISLIV